MFKKSGQVRERNVEHSVYHNIFKKVTIKKNCGFFYTIINNLEVNVNHWMTKTFFLSGNFHFSDSDKFFYFFLLIQWFVMRHPV
jgi:hypothetical protein